MSALFLRSPQRHPEYHWDQNGDQKEPPVAPNDPGFDSRGSESLDEVAKYLYDTDIHSLQGKQNITTFTIGYDLDSSDPENAPKAKGLLQRAATYRHGKFYTTEGSAGLVNAFASILNEVLAIELLVCCPGRSC